jgi:Mn-dependent DtxR family transcriptional regulator
MADYLGLTLETVSRQMSALKRDGVIGLEGKRHIRVPDFGPSDRRSRRRQRRRISDLRST